MIRDGEEDMWGGRLPKHRVTGWRAVSVLGLQGKGKARMQELYEDLSTCSPTIMSENIYVDVISSFKRRTYDQRGVQLKNSRFAF